MALRARILSQGDEITTGATLDTNAGWLARELWARGVEVLGMSSAPDHRDQLVAMFRAAASDADLIVSTGGLGPTDDDLSAEAAAMAAGVALAESVEALAQVEERFRRIERPMSPSNRKQALLPVGATVLENPVGSAPGFALAIGRARAFFFPGVPAELHVMAPQHLFAWLAERGLQPALRRRFHVCGVGESTLQDRLKGLELPSGLRLGYKTWLPYNTIVLYGDPGTTGIETGMEAARAAVLSRIGDEVFGEDETTLAMALGAALGRRGETLALAESCTAGLASALVTEAPGSSGWFRGAVVSYGNDVKERVLGVPRATLESEGAVSEPTARAMAEGVRRAIDSDWGIALTGIAGPGGGSPAKPVGLVCMALAGRDGSEARSVRFGDRGRDQVRTMAAAHAIEWLRRRLVSLPR